jgi:hypothetical protein
VACAPVGGAVTAEQRSELRSFAGIAAYFGWLLLMGAAMGFRL